ncbi:MAG TPA: hypothetical protein PLS72_02080 [Ilumatobacteraceae bacterium]|nr:hypothetical protein [Ilumatobacteraceae bacterium]
MSHVVGRLGAFALVLAGTFGTAYAVGERLPGHTHSAQDGHTHTGTGMSTPVPPGFESGGYQLVTDHAHAGMATFHLRDEAGSDVTEFTEAHGSLLHVVVIRPDLSDFQHVHPTIGDDGSWDVMLPAPGQWHLVFDSTPTGAPGPVVVSANIDDETPVATVPLPPADDTVDVAGLVVTRDGFTFSVANADGSMLMGLEPYLGQAAHLVAMRQGDLAYTHLHPSEGMTGMFMFGTGITEAGTYRLFLQFGYQGDVLTVPFTVVVP